MVSNKKYPIKYPKIPPNTDPIEAISAYQNDFLGLDTDKANCNTSGGIGKKEDSAIANINKANPEYLFSAQVRTQS